MKQLEERIRADGKIREGGVLKVDSFLNHQMDVKSSCACSETAELPRF